MSDDDFEEIKTHKQSTVEDDIISAIKQYLTLDDNPANILQRGCDLAGKYHILMIDIGVQYGIVEYATVPTRSA
jgi:hypothetical protein